MLEIYFDEIWNRIINNEGEKFKTKNGKDFTYKMSNEGLITSRTDYKLSKSDFKKAFGLMPLDGPGKINDIVRGPSYIWAILNDKRINLTIKEIF